MKVTLKSSKDLILLGWSVDASDDGETLYVRRAGTTVVLDADLASEPHEVVFHGTIRGELVSAYPDLFQVCPPQDPMCCESTECGECTSSTLFRGVE